MEVGELVDRPWGLSCFTARCLGEPGCKSCLFDVCVSYRCVCRPQDALGDLTPPRVF